MFKSTRNEYSVKTAPTDEPDALEELLNSMSAQGWELYTLHEVESRSGGVQYNCIFVREVEESESKESQIVDVSDFKSKMEKLLRPSEELYEKSRDIQQRIKEKHERISKIKMLLDSNLIDNDRQNLNEEISKNLNELKELKNEFNEIVSSEKIYEKIGQDKLSIILSDELTELVNSQENADLVLMTIKVKQNLTNRYGYVIPTVKIKDSETLEVNEYSINVRGIPTLTGRVYPGLRMFYESSMNKKPKNAIEDLDSIKGEKVYWIEEEKTQDFWEKGLSATDVIAKNLEYIALKYVNDILDYNDVNRYIEIVGSQNLFLIESLLPEHLSIGDLRYILASLIRERVPINDIVYVFEKINDFALEEEKEPILDKLRLALNRQISQSIADKNRVIYAIELADKAFDYFEKELLKETTVIKASVVKKLSNQINDIIRDAEVNAENTIIIVPQELRQILFMIFEEIIPGISVVTKSEISKEFNLEFIGKVKI